MRWWTDIDAIVYRSRTTPESSLNYAFFGEDGFDVESWRLGERVDVLTALVLHEGFTVNGISTSISCVHLVAPQK